MSSLISYNCSTSTHDVNNSLKLEPMWYCRPYTINHLEKRTVSSILSSIQGCSLATPSGSPVRVIPQYPKPSVSILRPDQSGNLEPRFSVIPRYGRATRINYVPTITRLDANSFANAPAWIGGDGKVRRSNNLLTIDHACK